MSPGRQQISFGFAQGRFPTGKERQLGMTKLTQRYFLVALPSTAIVHFEPSGDVS